MQYAKFPLILHKKCVKLILYGCMMEKAHANLPP